MPLVMPWLLDRRRTGAWCSDCQSAPNVVRKCGKGPLTAPSVLFQVCAGPSQILRRAVAVAIEISAIENSRLLGNLLIPQR